MTKIDVCITADGGQRVCGCRTVTLLITALMFCAADEQFGEFLEWLRGHWQKAGDMEMLAVAHDFISGLEPGILRGLASMLEAGHSWEHGD